MRRHFTATAFVVHDGRTLLHWHKKLGQWMPPGGHLLPGEDPAAAALREVREETRVDAELLPLTPRFSFDYPAQLPAPYTVLLEPSAGPDGPHEHIDFIYFARPRDPAAPIANAGLLWVREQQLLANEPLPLDGAARHSVPDDVRALALEALRIEREPGS